MAGGDGGVMVGLGKNEKTSGWTESLRMFVLEKIMYTSKHMKGHAVVNTLRFEC